MARHVPWHVPNMGQMLRPIHVARRLACCHKQPQTSTVLTPVLESLRLTSDAMIPASISSTTAAAPRSRLRAAPPRPLPSPRPFCFGVCRLVCSTPLPPTSGDLRRLLGVVGVRGVPTATAMAAALGGGGVCCKASVMAPHACRPRRGGDGRG